ncbi:methylamine utilization protein [Undibacterium sp. Jales W-56]|uniref:methylamine utilization protein n=1 Tax=Undibacterium sp. Jales W-56 TaxID=2897325 RepID=UPI0021D19762|nr:methylamine utilization protein [Undibacterium sp. Jales W-56]MCU6434045.1 methylamine utilization protein [Undibacterium sp. Jales W-56]
MPHNKKFQQFIVTVILSTFILSAQASQLVQVVDSAGQAVPDAVVYFENGNAEKTKSASAEIQQKDKKFMPLVTVVQTGTAINFPNNDTVRHHAYSFSPAKSFELKLYAGKPEAPILFDKSGTIVVGCNIHDQMLAYIQVVDTPYFAKTDANGKASILSIPNGKYTLKTWHYKQMGGGALSEQIVNIKEDNGTFNVKLGFKLN